MCCLACDKLFSRRADLRQHMESHRVAAVVLKPMAALSNAGQDYCYRQFIQISKH